MSARRVRAGWVRLSAPGDKLAAHWRHHASGLEVRHCGHPTANWPYSAHNPAQPELLIVSHNRLGFRRLVDAQAAVEQIAAGILELVPSGVYVGSQVRCATPRAS